MFPRIRQQLVDDTRRGPELHPVLDGLAHGCLPDLDCPPREGFHGGCPQHKSTEIRLLHLTKPARRNKDVWVPHHSHSNAITALGEIAEIRLGVAFRFRLEHDASGDVAILQMKDISESTEPSYATAIRGVLPNAKEDLLLREGDLVFRSRGRSNGAALVGARAPRAILAAPLLLIRPVRIQPDFLYWYMNSDHAQAQLASVAAGTSVQMISAESLRALTVPVPPVAAQQRIAEIARLIRREEELTNLLSKRLKQFTNHILTNYAHQEMKGLAQ